MLFYNRTIHEIEKFSLKEKIDEKKEGLKMVQTMVAGV